MTDTKPNESDSPYNKVTDGPWYEYYKQAQKGK